MKSNLICLSILAGIICLSCNAYPLAFTVSTQARKQHQVAIEVPYKLVYTLAANKLAQTLIV